MAFFSVIHSTTHQTSTAFWQLMHTKKWSTLGVATNLISPILHTKVWWEWMLCDLSFFCVEICILLCHPFAGITLHIIWIIHYSPITHMTIPYHEIRYCRECLCIWLINDKAPKCPIPYHAFDVMLCVYACMHVKHNSIHIFPLRPARNHIVQWWYGLVWSINTHTHTC